MSKWLWLSLLFSLLFNAACLAEAKPDVIGEAFAMDGSVDEKSGEQLLYRELHYYSDDGLKHDVVYQLPDGAELAKKTVDYQFGLTTPQFQQTNNLNGEFIAVDWQSDRLLMQYRELTGDETQVQLVSPRDALVIAAGFDHFIRENWQALMDDQRLYFYCAVAARQQLVRLTVKKTDCSNRNKNDVCFEATIGNIFLRWLVDSIEVAYDRRQKQLTRFVGVGNITDQDGNSLVVDIRYRYPN